VCSKQYKRETYISYPGGEFVCKGALYLTTNTTTTTSQQLCYNYYFYYDDDDNCLAVHAASAVQPEAVCFTAERLCHPHSHLFPDGQ